MNPALPLGRYGFIDHLRGFAALWVLVFHVFGWFGDRPSWLALEPLRAFSLLGWHGVHVFFVISGFCITEKIQCLSIAGHGPTEFLRDRAWRVLPPYWAALLFSTALAVASSPFNGLPFASALPESGWAAFADLALLQRVTGTPSALLVSWTLAYEAAFYLIAAAFFFLQRQFGGRWFFYSSTALAAIAALFPSNVVGGILAHWPEFWLGIFAHVALRHRFPRSALAALGGVAVLVLARPFGLLQTVHLSATATAAVLIVLHPFDRTVVALPGFRWLGIVGIWSYSLYLVHAPVVSRVLNFASRSVDSSSWQFVVVLAAGIAAALLTAWCFSRSIELPLEAWRRRRRLSLVGSVPEQSSSHRPLPT